MNLKINPADIRVRPTDRKIKRVTEVAEQLGILPKEMPITRQPHIKTPAEIFDNIKNQIQIKIDGMSK